MNPLPVFTKKRQLRAPTGGSMIIDLPFSHDLSWMYLDPAYQAYRADVEIWRPRLHILMDPLDVLIRELGL